MTPTQQIGIAILLIVALAVCYLIYRFAKRYASKKILEREERASSEGVEFKTLETFMMHLPAYCIKDDVMSHYTRKALESVGAEYQQRVFVDSEGGDDKTFWMRKKGNTFIHEKGFYFDPRFYSKKIVYHFKGDSRPIVDMANDKAWINPDMCSRFIYSAVNTEDMKPKIDKNFLMIIAGVLALGVLIAIVVSYTAMNQEQQHYDTVYNYLKVINQSARP